MQSRSEFPWPINVAARGSINGADVRINGAGIVRSYGVYDAILNFDRLPARFHPSAIGTFVVSQCCGAGASMRNGGRNMASMGVEEYHVRRRLQMDEGQLELSGTAVFGPQALVLDIEIEGQAILPEDLIGHSVYFKRVQQTEPSVIVAVGDGSLFRSDGSDIRVEINTRYDVKPSPLPSPMDGIEYRLATEDGVLHGLSYHLRIHSIFDGANTMSLLDSREFTL